MLLTYPQDHVPLPRSSLCRFSVSAVFRFICELSCCTCLKNLLHCMLAILLARAETAAVVSTDYRSAVQLTDSGADDLFAAAAMEVGLMSLELRSNQLTIRGGRIARATLFEHPCLESIDMRLNTTRKLGLLRVCLHMLHVDHSPQLLLPDSYSCILLASSIRFVCGCTHCL